jgi:hypothetical protein
MRAGVHFASFVRPRRINENAASYESNRDPGHEIDAAEPEFVRSWCRTAASVIVERQHIASSAIVAAARSR